MRMTKFNSRTTIRVCGLMERGTCKCSCKVEIYKANLPWFTSAWPHAASPCLRLCAYICDAAAVCVSSQGGNICMHPKTKAETLTSRLLSLDFSYNYGMIIIRVRIYFITSSSSVPSSYFCLLAFPFSLLCLHVVHHIVCFTSTVISPIPNCCSVTDCHRFGGEGLTSRTRFTGLLITYTLSIIPLQPKSSSTPHSLGTESHRNP